jgi:hypothetical protein
VTVSDRHGLEAGCGPRRSVQIALQLAVNFAACRRCRSSGTFPGRMVSGRRTSVPNAHAGLISEGR